MIKENEIKLVSKKEAEKLISEHKSFVTEIPICYDEQNKRCKYIKVELINGYSEGLFRPQLGAVINVFKYEI
jgi:hypothetical protein